MVKCKSLSRVELTLIRPPTTRTVPMPTSLVAKVLKEDGAAADMAAAGVE